MRCGVLSWIGLRCGIRCEIIQADLRCFGTIVSVFGGILEQLDRATLALVRLAARIASASEPEVREGCIECVSAGTPVLWVEEAILQSYLFAGFPRTLNAAREWRRVSGVAAPSGESGSSGDFPQSGESHAAGAGDLESWRKAGEETCRIVYGKFYDRLRPNIAALHPLLDEWMIVEGYGKILSRPQLELRIREYCVVAACVAAGQDRQLHSHLHGSLNAGGSADEMKSLLDALEGVVDSDNLARAKLLLARVLGK